MGGYPSSAPKAPQRIEVFDDTGRMQLVYFHRIRSFELQHPVGEKRLISGKIEKFCSNLQMTHPDYVVDVAQAGDIPACEPVYPATYDLSSRLIRKFAQTALATLPDLPDWQDKTLLDKYI